NIPGDVFDELTAYQHLMLRGPDDSVRYAEFNHDLHGFFVSAMKGQACELKRIKNVVTVIPNKHFDGFADYAKNVVWFGRRRGDTMYHEPEIKQDFIIDGENS
ncbi:MAG: hypothetical protein K6C36_06335, partial [Clostridia bacterium]|nr:hypothetical protein [Clostridia bacterium]